MTMVLCPTCGAELFDDDDPYADPDCVVCLQRSYELEAMEEELYNETVGADHR